MWRVQQVECFSCSNKPDLIQHTKEMHWKCNVCGANFKRKQLLTDHQQQWHGNLSQNEFREFRFFSHNFKVPLERGAVLRHLRHNHPDELYPCHDCDLLNIKSNFMTKADVLKHRSVYHKEENKCTFCGAMFPSRKKFYTHIIIRHMCYACFLW